MNNLVFNRTASELLTTIYGTTPGGVSQPINVTAAGDLKSVIYATDGTGNSQPIEVTDTGELKTAMYGTNDAGVVQPVEVSDTGELKTVLYGTDTNGDALPLNASDDGDLMVTVTGVATVSIINTSPLLVEGQFSDTISIANAVVGTSSVTVLADSDMSKYKVASLFLYNVGTGAITVALNLSPTTTQTYYIQDSKYPPFSLAAATKTIIEVPTYAHFAELVCIADNADGALTAYLNAQT